MPAVLERSKQVEATFERVAVARPERPLELRVARHASSRPLLSQENRLIGLADVAAIVPHRVQPCDYGREELVQAVCRNVTHRATEEVALRGPQHGSEVVMREGITDIVLEEGHGQRVHDGDVKCVDVREEHADPCLAQEKSTIRYAPRLARFNTSYQLTIVELACTLN